MPSDEPPATSQENEVQKQAHARGTLLTSLSSPIEIRMWIQREGWALRLGSFAKLEVWRTNFAETRIAIFREDSGRWEVYRVRWQIEGFYLVANRLL